MTVASMTTSASAPPIPADRATSLFRWNAALALLHGVQFLAMLFLSLAQEPMASWSITSSYLTFDTATRTLLPATRTLFELPIGVAVASFFAMSSIAHFVVAFPARGWYERRLARRQNPARWIEYAFSSSVMIVVIAMLTGIREVGTLIAIVGANAAMNLFGWSMEAANEGRDRPQWLHYIFGCIAGIVPWLVITVALLTGLTATDAAPIPGFVIAIYVSLFISFNVFAFNMVFQFRQIGRWRDYLHGERAYMLLSLFAKTLLAWQVWSGTLRP
ncbi:MAG: heliorhodopsin HeR [Chloroflexota bacterium]|nr:heliorhodopsin HeR [Chloroflexota bacterium]